MKPKADSTVGAAVTYVVDAERIPLKQARLKHGYNYPGLGQTNVFREGQAVLLMSRGLVEITKQGFFIPVTEFKLLWRADGNPAPVRDAGAADGD